MKYIRLTKEQLEELHQEFINFLATQGITGEEWTKIKTEKPELAEQELDVFSDLVWDDVLTRAEYLENYLPQQLFLFKLEKEIMHLVVVTVSDRTIDIMKPEGFVWLQNNLESDKVEFFTASNAYSEDRNGDIFNLMCKGAEITKGELYGFFEKLVKH